MSDINTFKQRWNWTHVRSFALHDDHLTVETKSLLKSNTSSVPYKTIDPKPSEAHHAHKGILVLTIVFAIVAVAAIYSSLASVERLRDYSSIQFLVGISFFTFFTLLQKKRSEPVVYFKLEGGGILIFKAESPSRELANEFQEQLIRKIDRSSLPISTFETITFTQRFNWSTTQTLTLEEDLIRVESKSLLQSSMFPVRYKFIKSRPMETKSVDKTILILSGTFAIVALGAVYNFFTTSDPSIGYLTAQFFVGASLFAFFTYLFKKSAEPISYFRLEGGSSLAFNAVSPSREVVEEFQEKLTRAIRISAFNSRQLRPPTHVPTDVRLSEAERMREIEFETGDRKSKPWGYGDYYCIAPNGGPTIVLPYAGEPRLGDSYHYLLIESRTIRGYLWSSTIRWSQCGRYFTCDWLEGMHGHYEGGVYHFDEEPRATVVIDTQLLKYRVLLYPTTDELHPFFAENKDDELWDILLDPNNRGWENLHYLTS